MNATKLQENVVLRISEDINCNVYSKVVAGIVKYILFFTYQLPIQYDRLVGYIDNVALPDTRDLFNSVRVEMYLQTVVAKMEEANDVFKALDMQYKGSNPPVEVCVAIGSTPSTCKEVYHIITPQLRASNVSMNDSKKVMNKILCKFVTNPTLACIKHCVRKPTVMYIFIKKLTSKDVESDDSFTPVPDLYLSPGAMRTTVQLQFQNPSAGFDVFEDSVDAARLSVQGNVSELQLDGDIDGSVWLQSVNVIRGFQDMIVKKQSVLHGLEEKKAFVDL